MSPDTDRPEGPNGSAGNGHASTGHEPARVGVYVCRFKMDAITSPEASEVIRAKDLEVIPIDANILQKYLA